MPMQNKVDSKMAPPAKGGGYKAVTAEHLEVDTIDADDFIPPSRCSLLRWQICASALILVLVVFLAATKVSPTKRKYLDDKELSTCPRLLWSDEFDKGELDASKWEYVLGDGCDVGLCGWGNNELEIYTKDSKNIRIEEGKLVIEAHIANFTENSDVETSPSTRKYTSAKIASRGLADFATVGRRFEASIKLPQGKGIWPAFWMLPSKDRFGGWPKSGEIDIMENIGKEGSNTVHGTLHYGRDWPNDQYAEEGIRLDEKVFGNFSESFHTFSSQVEESEIRFFVDNILFSTKTQKDLFPYNWPFREDFYFIFNLAVGGNWPGFPDGSTRFPQQLVVDYVRVYEGRFWAIEGPQLVNSFDKNVNYTILGDESDSNEDFFRYTWSVPEGATIVRGQGSNAVQISFGEKGGIVSVQRTPEDNRDLEVNDCFEPRIAGVRVQVFSKDDKHITRFDFDCGCPDDCNSYILNRVAGVDYTCGERIKWLIDQGDKETDACKQISIDEYNGHCGSCNPDRCKRQSR